VNLEGVRELKVYSTEINDLDHRKRDNVTGSQLLGLYLEGQIFGGQPHHLPRLIIRCKGTPTVSQPPIPGSGCN